MSTASGGEQTEDPLDDVPGVLARVTLWSDGRVRDVAGLGLAVAADTGNFVASMGMVLDTLLRIWGEVVKMETAPVRTWLTASDRYWIAGSGLRAWVLDRSAVDICAVIGRLEHGANGARR